MGIGANHNQFQTLRFPFASNWAEKKGPELNNWATGPPLGFELLDQVVLAHG